MGQGDIQSEVVLPMTGFAFFFFQNDVVSSQNDFSLIEKWSRRLTWRLHFSLIIFKLFRFFLNFFSRFSLLIIFFFKYFRFSFSFFFNSTILISFLIFFIFRFWLLFFSIFVICSYFFLIFQLSFFLIYNYLIL